VFRLTMTGTRWVTFATDGSGFDTVVYVRETTCATGTEAGCDDDSGMSVGASSLRVRLRPGTWYVFVDGDYSFSYGSISLDVSGI
jgi:hypothetical protein